MCYEQINDWLIDWLYEAIPETSVITKAHIINSSKISQNDFRLPKYLDSFNNIAVAESIGIIVIYPWPILVVMVMKMRELTDFKILAAIYRK